ncbi:phospholipid-binding lipoprotein MlaA [Octadecabacter temperatus]|uniref:Putative phospholipid-binding lipoprotein MlaA n=1 Tax=Octadecabacter temperatus TaxID=1458307 RepID=A0A0K0Y1G1_9RHOB|nr:VacJ family lipoprotein [Octadecabacter temperatus]AKS44716.1 putative phospholipid-binding lipoprotein MlaA precursor [Octadecabacter temperatus]SIO36108.1 phospholipid-binding lipoprotein MlaA [Octadecabacter temperatus]
MLHSVLTNSRTGCALLALVALSACAVQQPGAEFNDPFEETNRSVHAFNKGLDRAILRPAGQVAAALPVEITEPVANFADNVGLPGAVANGLLQGDIGGSATNTFRFLINTTVGIGGLFDPAGAIGLDEEPTDFGETLSVWGVPEGAYVELPVFGPSTQRDMVGIIVDTIFDPLDQVGTSPQLDYGTGSRVAGIAITRGTFMDTFDSVLYESADSYAQARLAYLQNRRFELGEEPPAGDEIDPFSGDLSLEGFE